MRPRRNAAMSTATSQPVDVDLPPLTRMQPEQLSWSPDQHRLALAGHLGVILLGDHDESTLLAHPGATACAWGPDGVLATGSSNEDLRLWDPAEITHPLLTMDLQSWVVSLAWSSDGRLSVGTSSSLHVFAWEQGSLRELAVLRRTLWMALSVGWSATGLLCMTGHNPDRIWVWDPSFPETPPLGLGGHQRPVFCVAWAPDGRLASGDEEGQVRVWPADLSPDACQVLTGHESWVTTAAWSRDGLLATGSDDHDVRIWRPGSAQPHVATLKGHRDFVHDLAWTDDGRLASASYDGTVRIWEPGRSAEAIRILDVRTG